MSDCAPPCPRSACHCVRYAADCWQSWLSLTTARYEGALPKWTIKACQAFAKESYGVTLVLAKPGGRVFTGESVQELRMRSTEHSFKTGFFLCVEVANVVPAIYDAREARSSRHLAAGGQHTPLDSTSLSRHRLPHDGTAWLAWRHDVKQPGQGSSDTLSYDRPVPSDGAGKPTPASRPDNPATAVLPESLTDDGATAGERPGRTDPSAVTPAPQGPISLTPSETPATGPVGERAPGAFRVGDQVDHFEIVGLVGQGGMGCVYKALDRDLGRTVAIKTLHGIDRHLRRHTLPRDGVPVRPQPGG